MPDKMKITVKLAPDHMSRVTAEALKIAKQRLEEDAEKAKRQEGAAKQSSQ